MKYVNKITDWIFLATIFFLILGFILILPEYLLLGLILLVSIGIVGYYILQDWKRHISVQQNRTRITY